MQVNMYYWKICGCGGHVYHENIFYERTCSVGGHVLQVCAKAATIEAAVSLVCWCFFFSSNFVFFCFFFCFISETCFPRIYCLKCSSWVCRYIVVVCLDDFFFYF